MQGRVDIVVTSNLHKNLGPGVEVVVGLPTKDPRSLPFAHKRIFAERLSAYDLFIYDEDDNLITQRNIDAFLRVTDVLPDNQIAGFLRTERDATGKLYFSEPQSHYRWDLTSVSCRGRYAFASYTNEHSGCYVLTRHQLKQAIASGGFLVDFHHDKYPPLETAATDPYSQCGFQKVVCISHLEDFLVPHLSNRYAGKTTVMTAEEFYSQVKALRRAGENGGPRATLFPIETRLYVQHLSKSYYEPCQEELISLVPKRTQSLLSVGCGWGETEKRLLEAGMRVKAIPMDSVIAASAESRGIEIVYGGAKIARERLASERFDCLLLSNVLHLVHDPVEWLASFAELLAPEGRVVASVPNLSKLRRLSRRLRLRGHVANPKSYDDSGMHATTGSLVRRWLRQAGLKPDRTVYGDAEGNALAARLCFGLARPMLGSHVYVSAFRHHQRSS